MKILIIEDTEQVARLLEVAIKKWGYQVAIAKNGKEALDIIQQEMFELILLDIFLPMEKQLEQRLTEEYLALSTVRRVG